MKNKTLVKSTGMFRIWGITFTWIYIQGKFVKKYVNSVNCHVCRWEIKSEGPA